MTISTVIVNYNSADFAIGCAHSLLAQDTGPHGPLEILVVDNASHAEDRARLDGLPEGVRRIDSPDNLGYAGAANLGFEAAKGEILGLLNPDLLFMPGSVRALADAVAADPSIGAVGPRTWMDEGRTIQHPVNRLPRLVEEVRTALRFRSRDAIRRESLRSTRHSVRYWQTEAPLDIEMLSGACLFFRREVLAQAGEFDATYPLYYEDADWCRRVGAAGLRLVYDPRSEIVHFYNMSAGTVPEMAQRKREASHRLYFQKTVGSLGASVAVRLDRGNARRMARVAMDPPWEVENLGALEDPPVLEFPSDEAYVIEFAGTPLFEYAAATCVRAARFAFPGDLWHKMPPSEVFVRLVRERDFAIVGAWRFRRNDGADGGAESTPDR